MEPGMMDFGEFETESKKAETYFRAFTRPPWMVETNPLHTSYCAIPYIYQAVVCAYLKTRVADRKERAISVMTSSFSVGPFNFSPPSNFANLHSNRL